MHQEFECHVVYDSSSQFKGVLLHHHLHCFLLLHQASEDPEGAVRGEWTEPGYAGLHDPGHEQAWSSTHLQGHLFHATGHLPQDKHTQGAAQLSFKLWWAVTQLSVWVLFSGDHLILGNSYIITAFPLWASSNVSSVPVKSWPHWPPLIKHQDT